MTNIRDRQVRNRVLRWLLLVVGWLAVLGGIAGIFLPLVPTVPLLLLAVACFARSSERLHRWLVEHDRLGPFVRDYLDGGGMPLRAKIAAIGMVWVSVPASAFIFVPVWWVRILLLAIAGGITIYLIRLPTRRPARDGTDLPDAGDR